MSRGLATDLANIYNSTFVVNLERNAGIVTEIWHTWTSVTKTADFVRALCGTFRSGVAARTNAFTISKVSINRHYNNLLWYRVSLVLHLRVSHSSRWLYVQSRRSTWLPSKRRHSHNERYQASIYSCWLGSRITATLENANGFSNRRRGTYLKINFPFTWSFFFTRSHYFGLSEIVL